MNHAVPAEAMPSAPGPPPANQPPFRLQSEAHGPLNKVLDLLLDAICVVDANGIFLYASAAFERIFGYAPDEVTGRPMIELVHPDDRQATLQVVAEIMSGKPKPHFHNRYLRKDGQVVHIMWSARWSEVDQVRIAVARDITELKRAEAMQASLHAISEAAHSTGDLPDLFRRIHEIISELLPARNFFVALYDEGRDELSFPYFVDEYDQAPAPRPLDTGTLSAEVIRSGQALLLAADVPTVLPDRVRPIVGRDSLDWLGVPLSGQKDVVGVLVVQSYRGDVRYTESDKALLQFVSAQIATAIERKQNQTWLQYIARHDQLTRLPNRELFHERLQNALTEMPAPGLALLYIDLDRFKQVNDSLGHDVGDLLLREAARRIVHCVRESDTVGRIGGDEFVVLLHGIKQNDKIAGIAGKIRAALCPPFELSGHCVHISSSIGVVSCTVHGSDKKQLLRLADDAMYGAKRQGGNRVMVCTPRATTTPPLC